MILESWSGILRVLTIGVAAYAALVFMLRISGKRTLSKMNAFDLIVTVALGSTLATILLNRSVSLAEGLAALALLIFLQYAITWSSVRSALVRRLVKSEPTLLVRNGVYLEEAMRAQRVTREEIEAAMRENGHAAPGGVSCVVLETDGSLSVISGPKSD